MYILYAKGKYILFYSILLKEVKRNICIYAQYSCIYNILFWPFKGEGSKCLPSDCIHNCARLNNYDQNIWSFS